MFKILLDLLVPKQNVDFSSIHSYISIPEIAAQTATFKVLDTEQKAGLEAIFVAANFENYLIADLLDRAKFGLEYAIADDLAQLLYHKVGSEPRLNTPDMILPVPADPKRFLHRGFHLPELIAQSLAKKLNVEVHSVIEKSKSTKAQTLLDRKARLVNLKNKFRITLNLQLNMSNFTTIWLVDDITTTGTTLYEVAKILKTEFPFLKIYGLVIASNY